MSALLSLPTELITAIVSLLSPFTLRELVKIHNWRLFEIVLAAYEPHRWYVQNARRHTRNRFNLPPSPQAEEQKPSRVQPGHNVALHAGLPPLMRTERVSRDALVALGLDEQCDGFISANPPFLRGWMSLDGSLDWLGPAPNETGPRGLADYERLERLRYYKYFQMQADRLGLTLPPEYTALYTTDNSMLPLLKQWDAGCLSQGPRDQIVRCPSSLDGLRDDGYMIPIFRYGQQCNVSLYLERGGWSCVVLSTVTPLYSNANLGILSHDFKPQQRQSHEPTFPKSSSSHEIVPMRLTESAAQRRTRLQRERRQTEREDREARLSNPPGNERPLCEANQLASDAYFRTALRLAQMRMCDKAEINDAAREGLQVGLDLLFHGPLMIVGLTLEEFLVTCYFENQLTSYFSHLNRIPSRELKKYVAHRYMPLYYDTAMEGKAQFLASFGSDRM